MARLRLLLGDDHALVRTGLRKILEERSEWEVVAEAEDGRTAVKKVFETTPDVAVLDIGMPQLNGIDATRQIVNKAPGVRVLILSMHADESYVVRALHAGARGYLLKDSAAKDLLGAVAAVAEGQTYFSPAVSQMMLDDYVRRVSKGAGADRYETLSDREREVFQLIAEGRSNKEVADLLSISATTVETHRAKILQKLDLHSAAELVLYAVRRGVIS
jgi:DNA-binding NarL/FixJ family response regulator